MANYFDATYIADNLSRIYHELNMNGDDPDDYIIYLSGEVYTRFLNSPHVYMLDEHRTGLDSPLITGSFTYMGMTIMRGTIDGFPLIEKRPYSNA